jgi:outer membrane protein
MKKAFVFLCLISLINCKSQSGWDLQQCIDYAVKHNISLKQSALNNQIIKNNSDQSKAGILPSLNLGAQHTYNNGQKIDPYTNKFASSTVLSENFYGQAQITLWSGLAQYNNIKASEYNYLGGVENLKQMQNDLALNIANAYITTIFSEELLKISQNQLEISKEQLERTQKLVNAGSLAKSNEYDILAQLSNEEVNVITADNNYQLSMLNLRQLMNFDSVTNFKIVKPNIEIESDKILADNITYIYETALKNQPGIKSGSYTILSATKTYAASKGRVSPSLTMAGTIGTGYSGLAKNIDGYSTVSQTLANIPGYGPLTFDQQVPIIGNTTAFSKQFTNNINKSVGFTLTVPLFNGLATTTNIKNSKINLMNAYLSQDLKKQNLYKTIVQAYANAKAALNKYKATIASVAAANESFKYAQQKFNAGVITSFDFNSAKNRVFAAESNLLQSKYDYIFKLKVLDYYQGIPLTL